MRRDDGIKTAEEIYTALLENFRQRIGKDVSHSCDLAVRLYAVAAQLEALYAQSDWVERQAFPQTAEEKYLDYHAEMRGLTRNPAVCAEGTMQFTVRNSAAEAVDIPKGTVCLNGRGIRYETLASAVISVGETQVSVPARAVEPGAAGNTGGHTVLSMSVPPVGVVGCTNPAPFTGGEDAESDESLRARILDSYQRLPNGANAAFYETQAMLYPGVAAARAVGRARGIGTVDVYIATTAGVPGSELLQAVQKDLAQKREIAVDVQVKAPKLQSVSVTLQLKATSDSDFETVKTAVQTAMQDYFTGERLGKPVLLSELYALLHKVPHLANYHILAPKADVTGEVATLPTLGALTVTELR